MSFEITGKLHKKYATEPKGDTFKVRELVLLTEDGQYPQYVKFQLTQDRCELLDQYEEGQKIKVHFDLRGREWQGKFFTNLNAWRLESIEDTQAQASNNNDTPSASNSNFPPAPTMNDMPGDADSDNGIDDLPF